MEIWKIWQSGHPLFGVKSGNLGNLDTHYLHLFRRASAARGTKPGPPQLCMHGGASAAGATICDWGEKWCNLDEADVLKLARLLWRGKGRQRYAEVVERVEDG
jgi:hypothetical protein